PADRVTKGIACRLASTVKDVVSLFIVEADVQVQPAPGLFRVRLGHEGCLVAVFAGDSPNHTFEEHAVVGSRQGILLMAKIYFELPWCILGRDGASGYALAIASLRDVLQQIFEAVNLVHTVDLGACLALAGKR